MAIPGLQHDRRELWGGREWEQNCPCDREGKKVAQLQPQTRKPRRCKAKQIPLTKDVIPPPGVLAHASKSRRLMPA